MRAVVGTVECGTCLQALHQVVPTVLSGGLMGHMLCAAQNTCNVLLHGHVVEV